MPIKKPLICALIVPVLLGGCAPFTKILMEGVEPVILASLLYLGSGIGLLFYRGIMRLTGKIRDQLEAELQLRDLNLHNGAGRNTRKQGGTLLSTWQHSNTDSSPSPRSSRS